MGPASLTDWLVLQETHVVQSLTLLGSQVLKPETDDALSLLQGTGREYSESRLQTRDVQDVQDVRWGLGRRTWEVKKRSSLSTFS